jgi:NADPH:quinone reductase-like Zn-dependent oxidoreductase
MKALVYHQFGGPEVLRVENMEKPVLAAGQVLLRVRAAGLNPLDWRMMRGQPRAIARFAFKIPPGGTIPGRDVAGVVEAVAPDVTQFKVGDEVFGVARGACAEYARARATKLVAKPANVSFEQAGGVGVAGLTALQGLRDHGQLQAGQKLLINGAAGGIGTFAVQIAKSLGAEVTAVCRTDKVELVRSLGADRVIDYTHEDFTNEKNHYDVLLDNVGNHPASTLRHVVKRKGVCVVAGAPKEPSLVMKRLANALTIKPFVSQRIKIFMAKALPADLAALRDLMAAGQLAPVVDRVYPLDEAEAAFAYLEEGHARGKVIVTP